jgi:hypothetical protein
MQLAPFLHGKLEQASKSCSQWRPMNSTGKNASVIGHLIDTRSVIRHKAGKQSSRFTSQRSPKFLKTKNIKNFVQDTKMGLNCWRRTQKSVWTLALEGVQLIEARAVVETRTVGAFVDIHVAMTASPSGLANASIIAHQVRAGCRMNSAQGRR